MRGGVPRGAHGANEVTIRRHRPLIVHHLDRLVSSLPVASWHVLGLRRFAGARPGRRKHHHKELVKHDDQCRSVRGRGPSGRSEMRRPRPPRSSAVLPGRSPSRGCAATRCRWQPSSSCVVFLADGHLRADPGQAGRHRPADVPHRPGRRASARVPDGGVRRRQPRSTRSASSRRPAATCCPALCPRGHPVAVRRHLGHDLQRRHRRRSSASSAATWAVASTSASAACMDLILSFPQLLMLLALSPVLIDRITALGVPAGNRLGRGLPDPRPRLLRLAVLRAHHPRPGAVPARARVRRGRQVPRRHSRRGSGSTSCCPTCGRRSSSTPR